MDVRLPAIDAQPVEALDAQPLDDVKLDDATFAKAVVAASIDETTRAARALGYRPIDSLSRDHIEALRVAGCTRDEARAYLDSLFGNSMIRLPDRSGRGRVVDILMSDLDSYGEWAGDSAEGA